MTNSQLFCSFLMVAIYEAVKLEDKTRRVVVPSIIPPVPDEKGKTADEIIGFLASPGHWPYGEKEYNFRGCIRVMFSEDDKDKAIVTGWGFSYDDANQVDWRKAIIKTINHLKSLGFIVENKALNDWNKPIPDDPINLVFVNELKTLHPAIEEIDEKIAHMIPTVVPETTAKCEKLLVKTETLSDLISANKDNMKIESFNRLNDEIAGCMCILRYMLYVLKNPKPQNGGGKNGGNLFT